ncbi:hypothetical protein HY989_02115 [Candidatus Micrarchaeota archaeon]|nr:hypothetical protein [Candidatus Micrarchaeota archaeon]
MAEKYDRMGIAMVMAIVSLFIIGFVYFFAAALLQAIFFVFIILVLILGIMSASNNNQGFSSIGWILLSLIALMGVFYAVGAVFPDSEIGKKSAEVFSFTYNLTKSFITFNP